MFSKKKILFFIGARGNSKGLRKKNIKKIGNRTLLDITISQAKKSNFYNSIAVSSESSEILKLAKEKRVDLIIKRPKRLSKDQSSKFDVWKHAIKKYEEITLPKTPVIESEFLEKGVFGEEGWSISRSLKLEKDND